MNKDCHTEASRRQEVESRKDRWIIATLLVTFVIIVSLWVMATTASAQQREPLKLAAKPIVITAIPGEIVLANVMAEAIPGEVVTLHLSLLGGIGAFQGVPYHQFAGTSAHQTVSVYAKEGVQVFLVQFFVTATAKPGQKSVGFQYWDEGGQVIELTIDLQIRESFPRVLGLVAHQISKAVLTYHAGTQSIQNFRTLKRPSSVAKIYYRYFDANGWEYDKKKKINEVRDTLVGIKGGYRIQIGFEAQYQLNPANARVETRVIVSFEKL